MTTPKTEPVVIGSPRSEAELAEARALAAIIREHRSPGCSQTQRAMARTIYRLRRRLGEA